MLRAKRKDYGHIETIAKKTQ